jgi:hypothetical protein
MKYEIVKGVNLFVGRGGYFVLFVMLVWDQYPGQLVLFAKLKEWTDVEDVDEGSQNESSGVRGVVEK